MNTERLDAAKAQANVDCERGLADLDASIATAPEYKINSSPSRARIIVANRAVLIGMRDFLAASMERQRQRDAT